MAKNEASEDAIGLLLLIGQKEWDRAAMSDISSGIYDIIAEKASGAEIGCSILASGVTAFRFSGTGLATIAARIPIGLVDAALTTNSLLDAYKPDLVALIGFGGILSDDLRIGDIAIASQVDCYLTKNKAAGGRAPKTAQGGAVSEVVFAGEVFRPSRGPLQSAVNLKHAFPQIFADYQSAVRNSRHLKQILERPDHPVLKYLRAFGPLPDPKDVSAVHAVHFASAEMVATSSAAVRWLRTRDRKLGIVDMESGGVLQAVSEHVHGTGRPIESLVIRGAGGFGDERHEFIRNDPDAVQALAFENAAMFLTALLRVHENRQIVLEETVSIDVGIVIPMEEEFSYFAEFMRSEQVDLSVTARTYQGRFYYFFERNSVRCAVTFVGNMGLVSMALATKDLVRAFAPTTVVVLGIAAGFEGRSDRVRVGDVAVASSVDLYLHRARLHYGYKTSGSGSGGLQFAELKDEFVFPTTVRLAAFALNDPLFDASRNDWANACESEMRDAISLRAGSSAADIDQMSVGMRPEVREVRLASGELLSAATDFVEMLMARGCMAADMESAGAVMACNRDDSGSAPQLLILRGISDAGNEKKTELESIIEPNFFRRACLRNASRLLISLIDHNDFAPMVREHDARLEP